MARVVLLDPLTTAAKEGRSVYIKSESLRMISMLYNNASKKDEAVKDKKSMKAESKVLDKALPHVATAIVHVLKDGGIRNAGKIRDVLNTADKMVVYCRNRDRKKLWKGLVVLQELEAWSRSKNGNINAGILNKWEKLSKEISDRT